MAAAPSLATPNHLPFRSGEIWQSGYGMCTGESTTRCGQIWWAANGFGSQVMMSGAWNYKVGLLGPYDGKDPDSVPESFTDDGAEPGHEFDGLKNLGFMLEQDFPSPQSPGFDPKRMFARPTSADLVKAYDAQGLQWHDIAFSNITTLREGIRDMMIRRASCKVAMFVDTGVMDNTGGIVQTIDDTDPNGGGHDIACLDASSDSYLVLDNWWRVSPELAKLLGVQEQPWGAKDGTWRITWDCLFRNCMQALAFTGAPLVKKVVA
jgi:hypothetical protein